MAVMNTIYRKHNYNIYGAGNDEFIVHNTRKSFQDHHTHIRNFNTAKYLIDLSLHKTLPKRLPEYLLISLIRLSDDEQYTSKLLNLLEREKSGKNSISYKDRKKAYHNDKHRRCNKKCLE